ncbi:unnamed protein product [Rangifer tarandus platyrhynchus]|uniref:Uncharacterized protein n=1 Tax=Rangifer tarandus platyrhynchus TaxID=3082113 RepID=A0AC59Y966_RANTA
MYWGYWEEKGGNTPGWETQESGAERWKGQDAGQVAARNQSSTDAYTGLGPRTLILGAGEEVTHTSFESRGRAVMWGRMEAGGPASRVLPCRRETAAPHGGHWEAGKERGHTLPGKRLAGLQGCAGTA